MYVLKMILQFLKYQQYVLIWYAQSFNAEECSGIDFDKIVAFMWPFHVTVQ